MRALPALRADKRPLHGAHSAPSSGPSRPPEGRGAAVPPPAAPPTVPQRPRPAAPPSARQRPLAAAPPQTAPSQASSLLPPWPHTTYCPGWPELSRGVCY